MTVLGVIPARGGSKGIPRKNLVEVFGRPLLSYTCEAALASATLDRVVASTDDEEIAAVARTYGIDVPFMRPEDLATDSTPMIDVLRHALQWAANGEQQIRALVLLQPTSPMRKSHHIDAAVDLFMSSQADTVVSVVEVPHAFNPTSVMRLEGGVLQPFLEGPAISRRQDKPKVYARNGPAILVVRPSLVFEGLLYGERTLGLEMSRLDSLDLDDAEDLALIECALKIGRGR